MFSILSRACAYNIGLKTEKENLWKKILEIFVWLKNVSYNSVVLKRQKSQTYTENKQQKIYSQIKNRNYKTESLILKREKQKRESALRKNRTCKVR